MRIARVVPAAAAALGGRGARHRRITVQLGQAGGSSLEGRFGRRRCDRRRNVGSASRRRGAPTAEVRCRDRAYLRGGRLARARAAGVGQLFRNSAVALRRRDACVSRLGAFRRSLRRRGGIRRRRRGTLCAVGREPVEVRFGVGAEDKDAFTRLAPAPLARRVGRRLGVACRGTGVRSAGAVLDFNKHERLVKAHRGHTLACAVEQRVRVGGESVSRTRGPLQSIQDQHSQLCTVGKHDKCASVSPAASPRPLDRIPPEAAIQSESSPSPPESVIAGL